MIANARSCDAFKLSPNCERMRKCVCLAWRRSVGKMQERYSTSYPSSDTAGTCGYLERAIVRNLAIVTYYLVILSEQILSQSRMFGSSPHLHHRLVVSNLSLELRVAITMDALLSEIVYISQSSFAAAVQLAYCSPGLLQHSYSIHKYHRSLARSQYQPTSYEADCTLAPTGEQDSKN